ncbi:MAG: FmdB family transcriptional regulator [Actinobacteria bacterium]|nr:FmdB family transcriptional regulator [Actinomycetota bacterium]
MPIYSYKCENCGKSFDRLEKAGSNGKVKCLYCDGHAHKIFSPVGIIFKGSGFYKTDYKSGSGRVNSSTNKPESESKEKPEESKTKPEVKTSEKSSPDNVKAKK